jgi:hypothetical protein
LTRYRGTGPILIAWHVEWTQETGVLSTGTKSAVGRRRAIGPIGTAARVVVGLLMAGSVAIGHWSSGFHLDSWLLGLVGFPAALLALQWARARRDPSRLIATGILAQVANVIVLVALYLTPEYAPALSATSDAALLFYGGSMLLAAVRGYAGCEVLAVSNWLLRRDDQVGCLVFSPLDQLERRLLARADLAGRR